MIGQNMKKNIDADTVTEKLDEYLFLRECLLVAPLPFWY